MSALEKHCKCVDDGRYVFRSSPGFVLILIDRWRFLNLAHIHLTVPAFFSKMFPMTVPHVSSKQPCGAYAMILQVAHSKRIMSSKYHTRKTKTNYFPTTVAS